jgi:methylglyoxal synthase
MCSSEKYQECRVEHWYETEFVDRNDPTVNNILSLCDQYNIPIATNLATAELLVKALENGDLEWRSLYN